MVLEASPGVRTPGDVFLCVYQIKQMENINAFMQQIYIYISRLRMVKMEILRIYYKNKIKVLISVKNMLYLTYIKITRCI